MGLGSNRGNQLPFVLRSGQPDIGDRDDGAHQLTHENPGRDAVEAARAGLLHHPPHSPCCAK